MHTTSDVADDRGFEKLIDLILELLFDGLDLFQVDSDLYKLVNNRMIANLLAFRLKVKIQQTRCEKEKRERSFLP